MNERLKLRTINDLLGEQFFIPHYQRGYRWTDQQVEDLLNDLDDFSPAPIAGSDNRTFYCLQPVVVKRCSDADKSKYQLGGDWYEVIDGQQRLTTIFLILHYANEMWIGKQKIPELAIRYATRPDSTKFLQEMEVAEGDVIPINLSNMDFLYISKAYETIHKWVTQYTKRTGDHFDNNGFQSKLKAHTKVIWYEVETDANSIALFTRLNMGKIPLTNAELIKALFLSASSFSTLTREDAIRKKIEIAQQWDIMEKELGEPSFWSFVTNEKQDDYPTKIELLFDAIAEKPSKGDIDPLHTFLHFLKTSKKEKDELWELWFSMEQYFLTLKEWFKEKDRYHQVGYLIATGEEKLASLVKMSMEKTKRDFEAALYEMIGKTLPSNIEELSYDNNGDHKKIGQVLLLFNVESIRQNENRTAFYPFAFHKGTDWSFEHIHAQNADLVDRTKKEAWERWLSHHRDLMKDMAPQENLKERKEEMNLLLNEIEALQGERLTWNTFKNLAGKIIDLFSENPEGRYGGNHSISNLALLGHAENAALSNSVFEVKRREIIRLDKKGSYIPICTRRIFFKYYNDSLTDQQMYFWGKKDEENYLRAIRGTLKDYLTTK